MLSSYSFCFLFIDKLKEENSLPSLRKALKDATMEKDAAIMARVNIVTYLFIILQ